MKPKNPKMFLKGERIYLRPFEREDLDGDYRQWINDPEVTHFLQVGSFPQTDDELTSYYEKCLSSNSVVFFAVIEESTGKHIGNAQIYDINWIHRTALRGVVLGDKKCWGKGYALEIIKLLNTYTFEYLNLNKLISSTCADNAAIQKLNTKAGCTQEGIGRQEFYRDGKYYDRVYWGILKSEYLDQKGK